MGALSISNILFTSNLAIGYSLLTLEKKCLLTVTLPSRFTTAHRVGSPLRYDLLLAHLKRRSISLIRQ